MNKKLLAAVAALTMVTSVAAARDNIQSVGSSTVYPFSTVVAENFALATKFQAPVIESTGTGGGMKLFCGGTGVGTPDMTGASRAIKTSESEQCATNGVTPIEVKIGYDGIVLANSKSGESLNITKEQIYRAVAAEVYVDGKFIENPYKFWSDIDDSLPNIVIEVLGPPPSSGTRDAFVELVMHSACKKLGLDKKTYKAHCSAVREDGGYIEAGENDNLIIQKLQDSAVRYGIFGFSFLDQNTDKVQGAIVDGVEPSFENVASGKYPVSRALYVYFKKEHLDQIPGLREFMHFYASEAMIGEEGITVDKGLIPLPAEERKIVLETLKSL